MKKYFAILLLLFVVPVFAQQVQVDVSKLTDEQKKALQSVANQMAENKSNTSQILEAVKSIDAKDVKNWADAGTEAGKAVANFTREIGVVTTEFLNSFPGKTTFLLLVMNYGGGKMAQFVLNTFIFVTLLPVFTWLMCRVFKRFVLQTRTLVTIVYNPNPWLRFVGINTVTKTDEAVKFDNDSDNFWAAVLGWALIAVSTFCFFGLLWPKWV
jgi:hypothetical protein